MTRRAVLTLVELVLVTAALSGVVYVLAAVAHRPGVPSATQAAAVGAVVVLALIAATAVGAIGIALWMQIPRMVRRAWMRALERRCARQMARIKQRQAQRRHAARIGGVR